MCASADPARQGVHPSPTVRGDAPGHAQILARLALAATAVAVLLVVFLPIGEFLGRVVDFAARLHSFLGLPAYLTQAGWEFLLNVALFVPTFFLAAFIWPVLGRRLWVLVAFCSSATIEFTQGLLLPRSTELSDIVSNTLGGLIGVVLAFRIHPATRTQD